MWVESVSLRTVHQSDSSKQSHDNRIIIVLGELDVQIDVEWTMIGLGGWLDYKNVQGMHKKKKLVTHEPTVCMYRLHHEVQVSMRFTQPRVSGP